MDLRLRKAAYIVAIAIMLALMAARSWSQAAEAQPEHFQRSFTVNPGATLAVENYKGTIRVAATNSNQVTVDVQKRFDGSEQDRKWWMENVKINFRNDPGRVEVKVDYPSHNCIICRQTGDYTASVELEIGVPRQINVKLDGYKPDIKVTGIQGDLAIKSYKAPMLVEQTTGAIHIDTYKDTIRLRDVTIRGSLVVKSYKADAEISALGLGQSAEVANEKGSIVMRVPANAGFTVDFEGGRHSSFSSDFALRAGAGYSGREVHGDINQGGSKLRLRTVKGSVELRKMGGVL